jgi:hypothetical protein
MRSIELGRVIAERALVIRHDGKTISVVVQIGTPQIAPDGEEWFCPWQILSDGVGRLRYTAGVDAVQSLDLVTQMIEGDLFLLNDRNGGGLCWPDGASYFRVPLPGSRRPKNP